MNEVLPASPNTRFLQVCYISVVKSEVLLSGAEALRLGVIFKAGLIRSTMYISYSATFNLTCQSKQFEFLIWLLTGCWSY